MKTLFFDLVGGISGDMTVGALLDLGVSRTALKRELSKLGVRGYALKRSFVERGHVRATKFDVEVREPKNYSLSQIKRIISDSRLKAPVKARIQKVYQTLASAEIHVHGHQHSDIRFEQLGEIDSIVDIAATCIALDFLGVEKIYYAAVPVSAKLAPATAKLLEGKLVYFAPLFFENVTPTGMAILAALGQQVGVADFFGGRYGRCGYGAGAADPEERSNVLRVVDILTSPPALTDEILVCEANIDDMNPQFFEPLFDRVLAAGALDVFVQPVVMKKSRPAFVLTVLSEKSGFDKIAPIIFEETTTIGIRCYPAQRLKLSRRKTTLTCRGQKVDIKLLALPGGRWRAVPEYDSCRRLAKLWQRPVRDIHDEIRRKAELRWPSQD